MMHKYMHYSIYENNMYMKYIMFSYPQPEPIKKAYQNDAILEKSSLGYATNNVHPTLPPIMND